MLTRFWTTCERTFSKMKLIKATVRNIMTDDRLSDLCLLAVEPDIAITFRIFIKIIFFVFNICCSHLERNWSLMKTSRSENIHV